MNFLVLWEHSSTPEGAGDISEVIEQDLRKGVFKEWGAFSAFGKGFLILNVEDEAQAITEMMRYSKFNVHFLSAEPFLSIQRLRDLYSQQNES